MRGPGETCGTIGPVSPEARNWSPTFTSVKTFVAFYQDQNRKRIHVHILTKDNLPDQVVDFSFLTQWREICADFFGSGVCSLDGSV